MTATSQSPRRRHFIEWVFCLLLMVLAAPAGAATKNILLVIAAGPDIVSPGRTNAAVVHVVDLFATILELAGVDAATALARTLTSTEQTNLDQLRVKLAAWTNVPAIYSQSATGGVVAVDAGWFVNPNFSLWRNTDVATTNWTRLFNATVQNRGATVRLTDPQPPVARAFYRVVNQ